MSAPQLLLGILVAIAVLSSISVVGGQAAKVPDESAGFEVVVLGRAQDGGMPHVGCNRPCCVEARESGRHELPASIGVIDRGTGRLLLIEATPAIDAQLAMLHEAAGVTDRGRQPVDGVLLTHAHMGHYLGLAQFGREVAATKSLPVHVSPRFAEFLRSNGPWSQLVELEQIQLHEFEPGKRFEPIPGLEVEPIPVPHRDEFSDTMAFKLHGPSRTVLFVPDINRWDSERVEPGFIEELMEGVDVAYVDGTFYDGREIPGRDLRMIPHPAIVDTMELFDERGRTDPGSIRFIHLNHTNPALHEEDIVEAIEAGGFRIAQPGERVGL
jgi:pyrroloquinoline quinone biosynthesis protein B